MPATPFSLADVSTILDATELNKIRSAMKKRLPQLLLIRIEGYKLLAKYLLRNIEPKLLLPHIYADEPKIYRLKGFIADDSYRTLHNKEDLDTLCSNDAFSVIIPAESISTSTVIHRNDLPDRITDLLFELIEPV